MIATQNHAFRELRANWFEHMLNHQPCNIASEYDLNSHRDIMTRCREQYDEQTELILSGATEPLVAPVTFDDLDY